MRAFCVLRFFMFWKTEVDALRILIGMPAIIGLRTFPVAQYRPQVQHNREDGQRCELYCKL